jgi:pyruvate dehydrogenase E2 component (dihydrolipoamide acetyltransferase)
MSAALTAITMPKWGLTMTEGKVVHWAREAGESFAPGDDLLEIETTKITNVVEAEGEGTLLRVVAPAGATLPIGALLAVTGPANADAAAIDAFVAGFTVVAAADEMTEDVAKAEPRMLDIGAMRLRYLEWGAGEAVPVVLLHGFGADLNSWMFIQPALADGRRTIALDLPGHGESTKQVGAGTPDALAAVVADALARLGVARAHLVGHSMGGAVAALVAARVPGLVATLTLIAPAGLGAEINAGFIDGFVRAQRRKDVADILGQLVADQGLVSRTMVEDVLRYKRIDGVAAALEMIAQAWFPGGRQACNLVAEVAALPMPVQIIWGRDDCIIPAAQGEQFASRLPVHVLDHAGHMPHMEKASEVIRLIRQTIGG